MPGWSISSIAAARSSKPVPPRLREPAEQDAEEPMPPRRLCERSPVREQGRDAARATTRVVAVDEQTERIEGYVLGECHRKRKPARLDLRSGPHLVVGQPEQNPVHDVDYEPCSPPPLTRGHGLAEDRDVRVVAPENPLVEVLLERPDHGRHGTREGRPRSAVPGRHPLAG
jgi:hypothetical protein